MIDIRNSVGGIGDIFRLKVFGDLYAKVLDNLLFFVAILVRKKSRTVFDLTQ